MGDRLRTILAGSILMLLSACATSNFQVVERDAYGRAVLAN